MYKTVVFILILLIGNNALGKSIIINNIKYTLLEDQTVCCSAANKSNLKNAIILQTVSFDNFIYDVTIIGESSFMNCKNLKSIILPNSINEIRERAFWNCENLEKIVMPDDAKAKIYSGNFGYGLAGIFKGCRKLTDVRGQTILYPRYVIYDAFRECKDTPFYAIIQERGATNMVGMKMKRNFTDFASSLSKKTIEDWQKRKDYETIAQWEGRVSETNRRKMIEEAAAKAHEEYLSLYAPSVISGSLESYNKDFGFFPVNLDTWGMTYVKVPENEAAIFESSWNDVKIIPTFGVVDDEIAVLSCRFDLNGKIYKPVREYEEDDITLFARNITSLASLREYEEMMASNSGNINQPVRERYAPDEIDINIPENETKKTNIFAVIIGNEDYQRVAPVDYAGNDARIFEKYCEKTLGIPQKNIRTYYNATYGDIVAAMEDLTHIAEAYKGDIDVIFYYAGHGLPDESNRNAYLLPIDATGTQLEACYPLDKLYGQLGDLRANSVVAFLDACFSGSLRGDGMLASARGIKLKPKEIDATGNMIVMSAASSDQSAYPFHEKNHGLFTYYLLKKLNESRGDITLGELADFISNEVAKKSIVENKKPQTPNIKWSINVNDTWRELPIR